MIALPVLAVTAADVVMQTQRRRAARSRLDRRLGRGRGAGDRPAGHGAVFQALRPRRAAPSGTATTGRRRRPDRTERIARCSARRPADRRWRRHRQRRSRTGGRRSSRRGHARSTCATRWPTGCSSSTSGRWPHAPDEVVVNARARRPRASRLGGRDQGRSGAGSLHRRRDRRVDVVPRLPRRSSAPRPTSPPASDHGHADLARRRRARSRGRGARPQRARRRSCSRGP